METGIKVAVVCSMNWVSIWFLVSHKLDFYISFTFVRRTRTEVNNFQNEKQLSKNIRMETNFDRLHHYWHGCMAELYLKTKVFVDSKIFN